MRHFLEETLGSGRLRLSMREEGGTYALHTVGRNGREGSDRVLTAGPSKWKSAQTNLVRKVGEERVEIINGNGLGTAAESKEHK